MPELQHRLDEDLRAALVEADTIAWHWDLDTDELRNLDSEKLESQLKEHYEELFNLRFQQVMGKLTASGRPRIVKREIARIKTILRERELGL